jgi:hypothetical protein
MSKLREKLHPLQSISFLIIFTIQLLLTMEYILSICNCSLTNIYSTFTIKE